MILAVIILVLSFLLYVWFSALGTPEKSSEEVQGLGVAPSYIPPKEKTIFGPRGIEQKIEPKEGTPSFFPSFSDLPELLDEGLELFQRNFAPLASPSPIPKPVLSEEEIFNKIWSPEYRAELKKIETMLIQDGELAGITPTTLPPPEPSEEPAEAANAATLNWVIPEANETLPSTDEEVFKIYLNILEAARANKLITEEEYQGFKRGINEVLPQLIQAEREALRRGSTTGKTLPGEQLLAESQDPKKQTTTLLKGLSFVFNLIEPTNAAWIRSPDCYKDDDPSYAVPGIWGWTFCCNCGLHFEWTRVRRRWRCLPHFEDDCGEQQDHCWEDACFPPVPFGCLNLVCGPEPPVIQLWPNAIWDGNLPLPTGICGCG